MDIALQAAALLFDPYVLGVMLSAAHSAMSKAP
jgi:hypothetical protein